MIKNSDIHEYIAALKASRKFGSQIVCHETITGGQSDYRKTTDKLHKRTVQALAELGVTDLYSHQAEAIDLIRSGVDVVAATPTASGKSLIYNIPMLESHLDDPASHFLYLFPLKALAQDQYKTLKRFTAAAEDSTGTIERSGLAAIYDGDTKPYQRSKLRKNPPSVLITNPEMLHLSMLPYHEIWSNFFKRLKYVVIDEIHTYRGVFGAHMSWVIKRLQRIAGHYGSRPTFIMLSGTIGNPLQLGEKLIGRKVELVSKSGAASSTKHMLFLNPWDSAAHSAAQLLEAALKRGLRTIVYTKSRKMTELITLWTKPRIGELAEKLSSYRAGFLPEERRQIESNLASGKLLGVISTSALELGIDIGDLDLCILVGYPGSIMATWQRSGRVGRGAGESAVILIGMEDALDQYFMRNPDDFFRREPEHAPLNPLNSKIMQQHLHCAAAEYAIEAVEPMVRIPDISRAIDLLSEQSVLHQDASGKHWYASRKRPQNHVSLRGGGLQLSIINENSGEIIGEIDAGRAMKESHPGAIYLHHSKILRVDQLDIDAREVVVQEAKVNYHTRAKVNKETEIIQCLKSRRIFDCCVSWGKLKVTEQVTGYTKVNNFTQKIITTTPLDLPEQIIETEGLWLDLHEDHRVFLEDKQMHFMGAIHAVEHAMIAMFPLLILCDRNDIGGISCPHHEQTDCASIFVYDGYTGGAGLCEEAYGRFEALLDQTERTIRACPCETGCPSCVHSPKCGSGNRPIDKDSSLQLLEHIASSSTPAQEEGGRHAVITGNSRQDVLTVKNNDKGDLETNHPAGLEALPDHYCVFDLETKRSAAEVGGWNKAVLMGISAAVVYDSQLDGFVTYFEDEAERLIEHLASCSVVVGFNNRRFDYQVLSAYTDRDLGTLPTLDLLEVIRERLGYRLSLNRLVEFTLGELKSADGLQALTWFREGKFKEIAEYCRRDVELTRNLFLFAVEHGHVLFRNKAGKTVRLPLDLDRRIGQLVAGKSF